MKYLLSTFGSAGDLFPLIPIAHRLRQAGDSVTWALPRSLGLYLRVLGESSVALGLGQEMKFSRDADLFTTTADGFDSWEATLDGYVEPGLASDVATLEQVLVTERVDAVVTSGFAVAARVAALRCGVRSVLLSIYPQHADSDPGDLALMAPATRRGVESLISNGSSSGVSKGVVTQLIWGTAADIMLRDSALSVTSPRRLHGYPYWDAVPYSAEELERVIRWLTIGPSADVPTVACCLGSFTGLAAREKWSEIRTGLAGLGARALFIGPGSKQALENGALTQLEFAAGYLPLSLVLPTVDLVIHHGGLGTTMAAIRAGRGSVVLPIAFDQDYNARLIEARGLGLRTQLASLADDLCKGLDERTRYVRECHAVQQKLMTLEDCTDKIYDSIREVAA